MRDRKTKSNKAVIDLELKDITPKSTETEDVLEAVTPPAEAARNTETPPETDPMSPPLGSDDASGAQDKPTEKEAAAGRFASYPPLEKKHRSRVWIWPLVIGLVALLLGYWLSSIITTAQGRLSQLETGFRNLSQTSGEQQNLLTRQSKTLTTLDQTTQATTKALAGLQTKGESTTATLENELATVKAQITARQDTTGVSSADTTALTNLSNRVEALELEVAALKSQAVAKPDPRQTEMTALQQASIGLRENIANGKPFATDYKQIAVVLPQAPGLPTLANYAEAGLPNAAQIAQKLETQIPTLSPPSTAEESFAKRWGIDRIVTIREVGQPNWTDIATQAAKLAQAGDLKSAVALIAKETAEKPEVLSSWAALANQRLSLEEALRATEQAVTLRLSQGLITP